MKNQREEEYSMHKEQNVQRPRGKERGWCLRALLLKVC